MPGELCPSSWQEYGCRWNIQYLWHWTNSFARLDFFVLTLLLAYIFVLAIRLAFRCHKARCSRGIENSRSVRELTANLRIQVRGLKSISLAAPYLGSLGACAGLLSMFEGFAMERHAAEVMLVSKAAAALLTTAAGILVAAPAVCFYNYFLMRIDLIERVASDEPAMHRDRHRQGAENFPLRKRFSGIPTFAMLAAPSLAILAMACTPFLRTKHGTGFGVELVPTGCKAVQNDQVTVLHITNAGKFLINDEEKDRENLASGLSKLYGVREQRTLDLLADKEVSFQTVVDVMDILAGVKSTIKGEAPNIRLRLITPAAMNAGCVAIPSRPASVRLGRRKWR
ncbi:MAG TPA: MotA/TolQ/ExbB proton channel family protein [Terriglobales bacterium]|nr:MotA/TolQ/ExbB proton channel family protein [Terriglobales bacterium]